MISLYLRLPMQRSVPVDHFISLKCLFHTSTVSSRKLAFRNVGCIFFCAALSDFAPRRIALYISSSNRPGLSMARYVSFMY